jgi:hypothetical protein
MNSPRLSVTKFFNHTLSLHRLTSNSLQLRNSRGYVLLTTNTELSLSVTLRSTVSQPVCLGIKHPTGAYDQIFITVRQLRVCWCGALSLMIGRVCGLQLLLALAKAVNFGSDSRGTGDHILLSQIRGFSLRRFLRLAGLQWRDSTPSSHGINSELKYTESYFPSARTTHRKLSRGTDHIENTNSYIVACWYVFTEPLPRNGLHNPVVLLLLACIT